MSIFDIFRKPLGLSAPWQKYYTEEEKNLRIPDLTMFDQIYVSAHKYPNNVAIEFMNNNITYKRLVKEAQNCAKAFKKLGIKKGEIVTLMMPNIPNVLVCLYGLNKIGCVSNMLHPLSATEEIKESLISTNSKYLVVLDMFIDKVDSIIRDTNVSKVIVVSVADYLKFPLNILSIIKQKKDHKLPRIKDHKLYMKYRFFMHRAKFFKYVSNRYGKDTPTVILHSGGTSGKPKNVVLQNRAFILGTKQEKDQLKLTNRDRVLAIMPNFHGFGLSVCMHIPLAIGATTILIPNFNAKEFDQLIEKRKPTIILGVPTLYEALLSCNNVKDLNLSFLRYAISGGDTLTANLENRVNDYFAEHNSKCRITQGYGLSEALAAVCLGHDDINKSGSCGIPLPGNHVKIIDPATMKTVKYGEVGEIVIHSKGLMMGYLNDESESNSALQLHSDGHIWLHTGDLGYMDEDGFVFYKGRSKRMIITSGYNVYPSHVEDVIERHPAVLQCTVVGVPHPYKQEVCKAFIVLKEGYHKIFVKKDIEEYCKRNLAKYMVPSIFVYRKHLPTTKLGKVDFKALQSEEDSKDDED